MKLKLFCIIGLCSVILVGCGAVPHRRGYVESPEAIAEKKVRQLNMQQTTTQPDLLYIYVDPETGVNYFVINKTYGCTMQVRYNSDGSVYVSDGYGKDDKDDK